MQMVFQFSFSSGPRSPSPFIYGINRPALRISYNMIENLQKGIHCAACEKNRKG
jgi:hypothetical protein